MHIYASLVVGRWMNFCSTGIFLNTGFHAYSITKYFGSNYSSTSAAVCLSICLNHSVFLCTYVFVADLFNVFLVVCLGNYKGIRVINNCCGFFRSHPFAPVVRQLCWGAVFEYLCYSPALYKPVKVSARHDNVITSVHLCSSSHLFPWPADVCHLCRRQPITSLCWSLLQCLKLTTYLKIMVTTNSLSICEEWPHWYRHLVGEN